MNRLEKIAINYLRKRNISVMINFRIENAKLFEKTRRCYFYDNDFNNIKVYDFDNELFILPKGKFQVEYKNEKEV